MPFALANADSLLRRNQVTARQTDAAVDRGLSPRAADFAP